MVILYELFGFYSVNTLLATSFTMMLQAYSYSVSSHVTDLSNNNTHRNIPPPWCCSTILNTLQFKVEMRPPLLPYKTQWELNKADGYSTDFKNQQNDRIIAATKLHLLHLLHWRQFVVLLNVQFVVLFNIQFVVYYSTYNFMITAYTTKLYSLEIIRANFGLISPVMHKLWVSLGVS